MPEDQTFEAGVIVSVRCDATNNTEAEELLLKVLAEMEELAAKQNVEFEWELQEFDGGM